MSSNDGNSLESKKANFFVVVVVVINAELLFFLQNAFYRNYVCWTEAFAYENVLQIVCMFMLLLF